MVIEKQENHFSIKVVITIYITIKLPIRDMAEIPLKRRKSSIQQTNNQPKSFSITFYTSENGESDRLHLFPSHVVYIYIYSNPEFKYQNNDGKYVGKENSMEQLTCLYIII